MSVGVGNLAIFARLRTEVDHRSSDVFLTGRHVSLMVENQNRLYDKILFGFMVFAASQKVFDSSALFT